MRTYVGVTWNPVQCRAVSVHRGATCTFCRAPPRPCTRRCSPKSTRTNSLWNRLSWCPNCECTCNPCGWPDCRGCHVSLFLLRFLIGFEHCQVKTKFLNSKSKFTIEFVCLLLLKEWKKVRHFKMRNQKNVNRNKKF